MARLARLVQLHNFFAVHRARKWQHLHRRQSAENNFIEGEERGRERESIEFLLPLFFFDPLSIILAPFRTGLEIELIVKRSNEIPF